MFLTCVNCGSLVSQELPKDFHTTAVCFCPLCISRSPKLFSVSGTFWVNELVFDKSEPLYYEGSLVNVHKHDQRG